jgi:hypothetical protein
VATIVSVTSKILRQIEMRIVFPPFEVDHNRLATYTFAPQNLVHFWSRIGSGDGRAARTRGTLDAWHDACTSPSTMSVSRLRLGLHLVLGFCASVSLGIFAYAGSSGPEGAAQDVTGAKPHGPADFRSLFMFNPLKGLKKGGGDVYAQQPSISGGYWPCSECHNPKKENLTRRVLVKDHDRIELHHGEDLWCLDCHSGNNMDRLHLASGELIEFEDASRLCGQCHGAPYKDWQAGAHGQRTGYWDGPKRTLVCLNCHWPHSPRFKQLEPLPPPVRPEFLGLGLLREAAAERERLAGEGSAEEGAKPEAERSKE